MFDLFNYLKPTCFDFIDHSGINYYSKRYHFKSSVGKIGISAGLLVTRTRSKENLQLELGKQYRVNTSVVDSSG